jgi:hypothetical protein
MRRVVLSLLLVFTVVFLLPDSVITATVDHFRAGTPLKQQATFRAQNVNSSTPTLNQFLGKNGLDRNRNGSGTGANGTIFSLDPTGYPRATTTGSLIVLPGTWPDAPTTGSGYPATCASHCLPTFTDNGSGNTWNHVFTVGTCQDSGGNNHDFYYAANVSAGTSAVTETHPKQITDTYWNISNWYNIATTSAVDTSSCLTGVTPANNTAPNITGTAITTTAANDLIYVSVHDNQISAVAWTSITVPAGCTLLDSSNFQGHADFYCIKATAGSFTPTFTIAQTTHDTFTIMAVAFKAGSGGSAPAAGKSVLLAAQTMLSGGASLTTNVACPTSTTTLAVVDAEATSTAMADSNSDTFTLVHSSSPLGGNIWYKTGITISNPNTFTVTMTQGTGNVDIYGFYCMDTTTEDTGFTANTGTGNTQVNSYTAANSATTSSGGAAGTYTNLPTATPGNGGDVFILTAVNGNGPVLTSTGAAVFDCPMPSGVITGSCNVATSGSCGGDANDNSNGDGLGHAWQSGTGALNWGWTIQNNSASVTFTAVAFK